MMCRAAQPLEQEHPGVCATSLFSVCATAEEPAPRVTSAAEGLGSPTPLRLRVLPLNSEAPAHFERPHARGTRYRNHADCVPVWRCDDVIALQFHLAGQNGHGNSPR